VVSNEASVASTGSTPPMLRDPSTTAAEAAGSGEASFPEAEKAFAPFADEA